MYSGGQICLAFLLFGSIFADINIVKQNGDDLSLSCIVKDLTIKWRVDGEEKPESDLSGSMGENNSTLIRTNINSTDAGLYQCYDSNWISMENYTVTVVSILGEDATVTDENKESVEIACRVDNTDITVQSLKWKRNGTVMTNSTDKHTFNSTSTESTLNISNPNAADAGLYMCVVTAEGIDREFEQSFSVNMAPGVQDIVKLRSKVEDETAKIECNVTGFPVPTITWYRKLEDQEEFTLVEYDDRVDAMPNTEKVPGAILVIKQLKIKLDRGDYMCKVENNLGTANTTVSLKVKDKLAAVWPFLGICAEVAVLCSIIFIFEKRRSRKLEEEEEVDAVKQDLMSQANGADDKELRQRNVKT